MTGARNDCAKGVSPAEKTRTHYFERWSVELHFREIKVLLRMDILRCLSPEMIEGEVWMHVIAYNLVRSLMQEAANMHERCEGSGVR